MNILLLEDDKVLAETIQEALQESGFSCRIALTGNIAIEASYDEKFDLYLLDINVPGIKGTKLLEELRASGDETPAIFITSKGDEDSVLKGYQSGADDYIRKPFTIAEMIARIKALLRRVYGNNDNCIKISDSTYFDTTANELHIGDAVHHLPKLEAKLLLFFLKNHGRILSKDDIIDNVWEDRLPSDTVVRVHIKNIKKIIGSEYIVNIKGLGYKFENR